MFSPHQMNLLTSPVAEIYEALEMEILKQVALRLKVDGATNIDDYRLKKMQQLNLLNQDVVNLLSDMSGITSQVLHDSILEAGYALNADTDSYMKRAGIDVLPQPSLDPILESYVNQTFRELNNFVNQTLITTQFKEGTVVNMFQQIIQETTAKVSTGLLTLDEAVEDTILQWADKGVPSTFIDKGGHTWSLERYTRTVLKSTNARVYNELRTSRMAEYNVYTVLVSTKPKARPACALCQGKVLDIRRDGDSGYQSVYEFGYGEPDAHRGINCGHQWFPFIPGVSQNNQIQYSTKEAVENEAIEQERKRIARKIVKTKKNLMVTEALESPKQQQYRELLRKQQAEMRNFIKKNKDKTNFLLRREYDLEKVYTPLQTLLQEYK